MISVRLSGLYRCLAISLQVAPVALVGCLPVETASGTICAYEGEDYEPGDSFPAADGCNSCSCADDGSVVCTAVACGGEGGAVCYHGGVEYHSGDSFPAGDGCNSCGCVDDGSVICTALACGGEGGGSGGGGGAVCYHGGVEYHSGDSFPAGDGCNSCGCMDDGSVVCTALACDGAP